MGESGSMATRAKGIPSYIAHFVIRTNKVEEAIEWYKTFLGARDVYRQDGLAFLTFDDEHHRIAIGQVPDLKEHDENSAGVDHIAFSMETVEDLVAAYERNKAAGIKPFWCINHGPTTSMYYKDPDGVKVEFQVDNLAYPGGPSAFFQSKEFAANPLGIEYDPEEFVRRVKSGESLDTLLARPDTIDA